MLIALKKLCQDDIDYISNLQPIYSLVGLMASRAYCYISSLNLLVGFCLWLYAGALDRGVLMLHVEF